ncbi:MAG: heterocyst development glycosyltransferase HepC [Nodularia sp. CChRGM 3473]
MTSSLIPTLHNSYPTTQQHQNNRFPHCTLQWRRGQLLVKSSGQAKQPYLPSLNNEQLLVNCLKHSLVSVVSIDPNIGEDALKLWIEACEKARKPVFLRIPSSNKQPRHGNRYQRLIDWIAALILLVLMSPVMLALCVLIQIDTPGSVFTREWHVGERGKLFRAIKFCTTKKQNITPLGHLMRKYDLDNLPQLVNVLCGEMSLMGSRSWTLKNALQLTLEEQQINQLPVITDSWEEPKLLRLDS